MGRQARNNGKIGRMPKYVRLVQSNRPRPRQDRILALTTSPSVLILQLEPFLPTLPSAILLPQHTTTIREHTRHHRSHSICDFKLFPVGPPELTKLSAFGTRSFRPIAARPYSVAAAAIVNTTKVSRYSINTFNDPSIAIPLSL